MNVRVAGIGSERVRKRVEIHGTNILPRYRDNGQVGLARYERSKPSANGRGLAKRACSTRKPGSAATPPEYWNWWATKRYPPAGKGSTVGMGAASIQIGSEPNIARHLAFVIPEVTEVPKPFHSGDVAFELCYLPDMPAVLRALAQAAEQLGYYSLWLNEFLETEPNVRARFEDPPSYYDALTTLGYLAALTHQIRFLPSVIVLPLHHPILLNRQIATLDVLSGGRVTLGIGLGGSLDDYRRLRGELGAVNRGQMMDEFAPALRALWSEEKASFSGRFVNFRDVQCFPKPLQNPLPLYMAGEADAVLRRIGRFGQGCFPNPTACAR